ncbi:MAG TPA: DNA-directed RNA polymerase subunit omega [Pyrinomonadaceae bacterium]|jgi:DNA-directed RNA polymerase subunit omega
MVDETENNIDEQNEAGQTNEATENKTQVEIDSKYRMIILAAQRSKQLQRGATPRVDADMRKQKPTRIAMKEIEKQKVDFEVLDN